jgi:hypothetical protein
MREPLTEKPCRRSIRHFVTDSAARLSLSSPVFTSSAICSSVNTITYRAAQNASSGNMLLNAGLWYSGVHVSGSNRSYSNLPTDGRLGYCAFA